MSETTKQFKKQLPKNAVMSALSFGTYMLSALWLTPYLVKNLGSAAYGIIPLAGLFTQYVSLISGQIQGAVNRFLTVEIQKPDGKPNVIFNSAFTLFLLLNLIQLPLFLLGLYYVDHVFDLPPEVKDDAVILIGCSVASFMITLVGSVFGISAFSKNRLDISYAMGVSQLVLRLLLIFSVFSLAGPRLRYLGYIDLTLQVLFFMGSILVWRKLTPELSISFKDVDWRILKPVFRMSMWSLVSQFGAILYLRSDIWIINRFISPVAAGQYAAVLVAANFIRQIGIQFTSQFSPTIMSYWAKDDLVNLKKLLALTVKFMAAGLAIPVMLIYSNGSFILQEWLGDEFASLGLLLAILVIHLPINTSVLPFFTLNSASNRVKLPALVTLAMGIVNVIASYYAGVILGMGAIGVALATAVVLTLKNAFFTPVYAARILNLPSLFFTRFYGWSILVMGVAYALCYGIRLGMAGHGSEWIMIGVQVVVVGLVCGLFGWRFIFEENERGILLNALPAGVRKKLPSFMLKPSAG